MALNMVLTLWILSNSLKEADSRMGGREKEREGGRERRYWGTSIKSCVSAAGRS